MMPLTWVNIENLEKLLTVRPKLNALGTWVAGDGKKAIEHTYSNIASGMTATNVQSAIDELSSGKANKSTVVISAVSTLSVQEPSSVNTPYQLSFGASQGDVSWDAMIDATGTITFNKAGTYTIHMHAHYGRTGSNGTSILFYRYLINDTQVEASLAAKVDNSEILIPYVTTFNVTVSANDTLKFQILRDSAGDNSGGIYAQASSAGWNDAACAAVEVLRN